MSLRTTKSFFPIFGVNGPHRQGPAPYLVPTNPAIQERRKAAGDGNNLMSEAIGCIRWMNSCNFGSTADVQRDERIGSGGSHKVIESIFME